MSVSVYVVVTVKRLSKKRFLVREKKGTRPMISKSCQYLVNARRSVSKPERVACERKSLVPWFGSQKHQNAPTVFLGGLGGIA